MAHRGTAAKKLAATEKDTTPSSTMRKNSERRAVIPPSFKNDSLEWYQYFYRLMIRSRHFRRTEPLLSPEIQINLVHALGGGPPQARLDAGLPRFTTLFDEAIELLIGDDLQDLSLIHIS